MKILITGSNGFVGSSLMPYLENLGYTVDGIDRDDKPLYNIHKNTVIADIIDIHSIEKLNNTYDLIIHCAAAKSDFGISDKDYFRDNEKVTEVLVDYAEKLNIKKIIYYSTVSVYGHQSKPCGEEGEIQSNTVYGDSKLAGEVVIENWLNKEESRQAVFLRPSVIYGPNNYANMYNLIDQLYGNPLLMIGSGNHIKSMVALKNLLDMTHFVMLHSFNSTLEIYNCLDKPYYTVNKLMKIIASVDGFNMPKLNIPIWLSYVLVIPFEVLSKLTGKDLKINWDRINKFTTATDYLAENLREKGYVQKYSTKDELIKMANWYKTTK